MNSIDYTYTTECLEHIQSHLLQDGYCVLTNVMNKSQVAFALDQLWSSLERSAPGLDRNRPMTWTTKNRPALGDMNSFNSDDYAAGAFITKAVYEVFALVYGGVGIDIRLNRSDLSNVQRKTVSERHVMFGPNAYEEIPTREFDLFSVVNLVDNAPGTGNAIFGCYPASHLYQASLSENPTSWTVLSPRHKAEMATTGMVFKEIDLPAGSMILYLPYLAHSCTFPTSISLTKPKMSMYLSAKKVYYHNVFKPEIK